MAVVFDAMTIPVPITIEWYNTHDDAGHCSMTTNEGKKVLNYIIFETTK
jgi:hypothetical protein